MSSSIPMGQRLLVLTCWVFPSTAKSPGLSVGLDAASREGLAGALLVWLAEAFSFIEGAASVSWCDGTVADLLLWFVDAASSREGPAGDLLLWFTEAELKQMKQSRESLQFCDTTSLPCCDSLDSNVARLPSGSPSGYSWPHRPPCISDAQFMQPCRPGRTVKPFMPHSSFAAQSNFIVIRL
jgi:hypothetical protein